MTKRDLAADTIAVYEQLGRTYADRIAAVELPRLETFIRLVPKGARVLDVGCAAGRDSAKLADAGFEVHGIDLCTAFLDIADREVHNAHFYRMDARSLDFADGQFDAIWAHAVLLNMPRHDAAEAIGEFHRVLKPGGICTIAVKEGTGEALKGEELAGGLKRLETYFTDIELETLLLDAGFTPVATSVQGDELGRASARWVYVTAEKQAEDA